MKREKDSFGYLLIILVCISVWSLIVMVGVGIHDHLNPITEPLIENEIPFIETQINHYGDNIYNSPGNLESERTIQLPGYGSGTIDGTPIYYLMVNKNGTIVETLIPPKE